MDDETVLPKATIINVAKELLPEGVKFSVEARDLIIECCNEFVQLVGSESHTKAIEAKSSTIRPQDVLNALQTLDMPEYVEECQNTMGLNSQVQKNKREGKKRNKIETKAKAKNMSMEDMKRLQQEKLQASRARMQSSAEAARINSDLNRTVTTENTASAVPIFALDSNVSRLESTASMGSVSDFRD